MRYSDWQIDRIRSRLVAYRYKKGNNGRPRPWKGVLYDILLCPDTDHVFPEDGSHPEFKEEALRRFAAGTSILTPDKIHDLRVFLAKEHFLKAIELSRGEFLMAYIYYANYYAKKAFDKDVFISSLESVLNAPADINPDLTLLNTAAHAKAKMEVAYKLNYKIPFRFLLLLRQFQ